MYIGCENGLERYITSICKLQRYLCLKRYSLNISVYIYAGRVRSRRQSAGSATSVASTPADTRGRSRAKVVSQSQRK